MWTNKVMEELKLLGDNIRKIRKEKKISINNLARITGISVGYISDLENNNFTNPTIDKLDKIADALGVSKGVLFEDNIDNSQIQEVVESYNVTKFNTAEDAIKFILKQQAIMDFGGFDINKLSDKEILQFANELLNQLQLLGLKYKK